MRIGICILILVTIGCKKKIYFKNTIQQKFVNDYNENVTYHIRDTLNYDTQYAISKINDQFKKFYSEFITLNRQPNLSEQYLGEETVRIMIKPSLANHLVITIKQDKIRIMLLKNKLKTRFSIGWFNNTTLIGKIFNPKFTIGDSIKNAIRMDSIIRQSRKMEYYLNTEVKITKKDFELFMDSLHINVLINADNYCEQITLDGLGYFIEYNGAHGYFCKLAKNCDEEKLNALRTLKKYLSNYKELEFYLSSWF